MGKLMNIYFSAKAGSSLLKKTGIIDKITVDKLAAEEQSYIESHNIDKDVDFNYADMKYNEFYENSMDLNTRCSVAALYADAVKNGIVDGTEADAVTMIDYAHNMPTGENSEAELAEYNKQFDPKIIEAYNKQLDEYTKFKAEYETLTDEQKAERMNADPRYAVMGTSCEYDKATAKAAANGSIVKNYGMSGVKYLKERDDVSMLDIAIDIRGVVEEKLKKWGVREETVDKISNFVFGVRTQYDNSEHAKAATESNKMLESRGVNFFELMDKSEEATAKRISQAKSAGVYMEDTSASTQKTASNEASMV